MKKGLIIIGAGGHGKVCADVALKMKKWSAIFFLDDSGSTSQMGFQILGRVDTYKKYLQECDFFVSIGNNKYRQDIMDNLLTDEANLATLIHPSVILGANVQVGIGTVLMPGVIINTATKIGQGVIVNTSVSIDHDGEISDYVHISPGCSLAGNVFVGLKTWIGIGSVISNNIRITSNCVLGAGSVVIKNLETSGTYVGHPVKLKYS